jgi:hypothetical protein
VVEPAAKKKKDGAWEAFNEGGKSALQSFK